MELVFVIDSYQKKIAEFNFGISDSKTDSAANISSPYEVEVEANDNQKHKSQVYLYLSSNF